MQTQIISEQEALINIYNQMKEDNMRRVIDIELFGRDEPTKVVQTKPGKDINGKHSLVQVTAKNMVEGLEKDKASVDKTLGIIQELIDSYGKAIKDNSEKESKGKE